MLLISRSAYEDRRKCARAFYYRYLYARTGYAESRTPFHLAFGIALHAGMESLMRGARLEGDGVVLGVNDAVHAAHAAWTAERPGGSFPPSEPPEPEVLALLEALVRGWCRVEAERFFSEYEVVSVEREGEPQPLSPSAALQFRADVVVRSRWSGALRVINWKTSSGWGDWTDSWTSEVQAFSEAWALAREAGEPVEGTVMAGFHKGSMRQTGGETHFSSPLIWGYKRRLADGTWIYSSETKAPPKAETPWVKFKVWEEEFEGVGFGVEAWLRWLPAHAVAASFMTSEPLVGHPKTVAAFIEAAGREARDDHHVLADGSEADKLAHFIPKFGKFSCGTRDKPACAFWRVCFTDASVEDLIAEGLLVPRVDHHAPKEGS